MTTKQRPLAAAATFASVYYQVLVTSPKSLVDLYLPEADSRHSEAAPQRGIDSIRQMLATQYPVDHHGRITVHSVDMRGAHEPSTSTLSFVVKGRYTPNAPNTPQRDFSHLVELEELAPHSDRFGIKSDVMSWAPVPTTQANPAFAPAVTTNVTPPAVMASWADDTPETFAKPPPKEVTISPLQQPISAVPPPPPAENGEDSDDDMPRKKRLAQQQAKDAEAASEAEAAASSSQQEVTEGAPCDAPAATPQSASVDSTSEPKAEEGKSKTETPEGGKVESPATAEQPAKPLSLAEKLRLKQGLPLKEEKPKAEPAVVEAKEKSPAATGSEKKNQPKKPVEDAEKKALVAQEAGKEPAGSGKDPKKPAPKKGAEGEKDKAQGAGAQNKDAGAAKKDRRHSNNIVYYHVIVKGLPLGTAVEELYALLEPHVPVVRPIKLEARPDKADPSVTRTYAFVLFDQAKLDAKNTTLDQVITLLKRQKFSLKGTSIIVDRVREKYSDLKEGESKGDTKAPKAPTAAKP